MSEPLSEIETLKKENAELRRGVTELQQAIKTRDEIFAEIKKELYSIFDFKACERIMRERKQNAK